MLQKCNEHYYYNSLAFPTSQPIHQCVPYPSPQRAIWEGFHDDVHFDGSYLFVEWFVRNLQRVRRRDGTRPHALPVRFGKEYVRPHSYVFGGGGPTPPPPKKNARGDRSPIAQPRHPVQSAAAAVGTSRSCTSARTYPRTGSTSSNRAE